MKTIFSILCTFVLSTFLVMTALAGDTCSGDTCMENPPAPDNNLPTTSVGLLFNLEFGGAAGAIGAAGAFDGNGDSIGVTNGFSTTFSEQTADTTVGGCDGCDGFNTVFDSRVGASNVMEALATGVDGPLTVEAQSLTGGTAFGEFSALRQGNLVPAPNNAPADDDNNGG